MKNRLANVIGTQYAFVMTPEMLSALGRQFVQYERWMGKTVVYPRDDRGVMGGPVTDNKTYIDGGLEVMCYRGIPIIESSFLASLGRWVPLPLQVIPALAHRLLLCSMATWLRQSLTTVYRSHRLKFW